MKDTDLNQTIAQLGDAIKNIVNTSISVKDVRIERTDSLEFQGPTQNDLFGKGLIWNSQEGANKKFILRHNKDRFWSTESIDLDQGKSYKIDNVDVINQTSLGPTVRNSNLTSLGTLTDLKVFGNINIDNSIFWNTDSGRLGIGTEEPKAALSIASLSGELIFDVETTTAKFGTYTNNDLELVTGNVARIKVKNNGNITLTSEKNQVSIPGKLAVGLENADNDVDLSVSGNIRFNQKKFESGTGIPTSGLYRKGDIVWNANPRPTGYIGWVCVREGTPGEWKPFGQIYNQ